MKRMAKAVLLLGVMVFIVACHYGVPMVDGFEKRYVHNMTDRDITVVCHSIWGHGDGSYCDSVVVAPGEYYLLEEFQCVEDNYQGAPETILYLGRLYFYMDGIGYQVDRNDLTGCLWLPSFETFYHPYAPNGLSERKYDVIRIFDLTEEYIRAQIPL